MAKRLRAKVSYEGKVRWVQGYTKKELEEAKINALVELRTNHVVIDKNTTVRVWAKEWFNIYKTDISKSWKGDIDGYLKNVIFPIIGSMPLHKVKQMHIKNIFKTIEDKSSSYNHKVYIITKQLFNDAVNNDLLYKNPVGNLKCPVGVKPTPKRSVTPEERKALLEACKTARGGLFCEIMLYCGLRPGEVAALTWDDVDFDTEYIDVNKALKSDSVIGLPKSDAGIRKVPIPKVLLSELKKNYNKGNILVCPNSYGDRLSKMAIHDLWVDMTKKMNIIMGCKVERGVLIPPYPLADDLTLYCLRHTFCTDLEIAGVPINIAKTLMGHESIELTSKIYTHTQKESLEIARNLMNNCQGNCQDL